LEALEIVGGKNKEIPFILVSGTVGEAAAVECIKAGADDYIVKDSLVFLGTAVERAIKEVKLLAESAALESALMDAAREWKSTFNSIKDSVCLIDKDRKIKRCNQSMANMFGRAQEEIVGENCCSLIHGSTTPLDKCPISRAIKTKRRETEDMYIGGRWFSVTADPVFDSGGKIINFVHIIRDISESKKAAKEWEDIFQAIGHPTMILDPDYRIIDINEAAIKAIGRPENEIRGRKCHEFYHVSDRNPEGCPLEAMKRSGKMETNVMEMEALGGFFFVSCTPVLDGEGRLEKIIHISTDVTARRKAEESLGQSEAKFRQVFESKMMGMLLWNAKGDIAEANETFLDMTGYSRDELIAGKLNWKDMTPAKYKAQDNKALKEVGDTGKIIPIEKEFIHKDGSRIPVLVGAALLPGEGLGGVAFVLDISERKKIEKQLLKEMHKSQSYLDIAGVIIIVLDAKGRVTLINKKGCSILGYKHKDIIGKNWFTNFLPKKIVPEIKSVFANLIEGRQKLAKYHENAILTKKGQEKLIAWHNTALKDEAGNIIGILSSGEDITQQRKAEKSLKESEERYKTLFGSANDGIFIMKFSKKSPKAVKTTKKSGGIFVECNNMTLKIFGNARRKDIIGKSPEELSPPEQSGGKPSYELAYEKLSSALEGKPQFFEWAHYRMDGTPFYAEVSLDRLVVRGEVFIQAIIRDITERKRIIKELEQSEEKFRILYESSRDAIMTLEPPDWNFTAGNPSTINMFRAKDEAEFTSMAPYELSPKYQPDRQASKKKALDMINTAMKRGSYFFEWTHKRINGEEFPATVLLAKVKISGKEFLQATVRDITESKKAQNALKESEKRYRTLFDNAAEGILVAGLKTKEFSYANPAIHKMLGYKYGELIGKTIRDIHPKDSLNKVLSEIGEQIKGKKVVAEELPCLRKDGKIIWVDISTTISEIDGQQCAVGFFTDITERKITQEALKERERLLSRVEYIAKIGGWEMDLEKGGKATWTKGTYDIVEINPGEPIPGEKEHVKWYLPEYRKMIKKKMQNLAKTGQHMKFEAILKTKKGNFKWCQAIGEAVKRDGRVVKLRGTFQDITDLKEAEEKIKRTEEKFRNIVERSYDSICMFNKTGDITYISPAVTRVTGYSSKEAIGTNLRKYIPKSDLMRTVKAFSRLIKGETIRDFALPIRAKSRKIILAEANGSPVYDGKKIAGAQVIFRDVSDRKKAINALVESEQRYRTLFEGAPDGIIIADTKTGEYIEVNPAICKKLGYSKKEIKALSQFRGIHPKEDVDRIKDFFYRQAKGEIDIAENIPFVKKDGSLLYFDVTSVIVEINGVKRVVGLLRDVTERKRVEQAKAHLMRDVTHGLKTPIAISQMALYVCKDGMKRGDIDEINEAHDIVANNLKILYKDIDNILTSTTVDMRKGEKVIPKKHSFLKSIAKDTVGEIKKVLEKKDVKTRVDIAEDANKVAVAPRDIRILLNCLVDNAFKFTEKGEILITSRSKKKYIELKVEDTGCGIAKKHISRIFDKFYKRHPAVEGSGLGLSICRDIAQMYNGDIEVKSEGVNKGTTVVVTLPKG
jgi:PAS domain S-box-containing protein